MMTKQDFIALANALKITKIEGGTLDDRAVRMWIETRNVIADVCARSNPRFDRNRWLAYISGEVGPSGGAVKGRS